MREEKVAKVTISLPQKLVEYAERLAKEQAKTRSGVIAELLEKEEKERIEALMEEGYRETAEENRRLAEEAFQSASEMLHKCTQLDEHANG